MSSSTDFMILWSHFHPQFPDKFRTWNSSFIPVLGHNTSYEIQVMIEKIRRHSLFYINLANSIFVCMVIQSAFISIKLDH